jgi:hypothetical protein
VSAYSPGAAKVLYSNVELGKLEPRQSDTNVKPLRPAYGPALCLGVLRDLPIMSLCPTPSMLDNTGAAQKSKKQGLVGSRPCYAILVELSGVSLPEADGIKLSVLHLPQVPGHIQQNPNQVEHSFH